MACQHCGAMLDVGAHACLVCGREQLPVKAQGEGVPAPDAFVSTADACPKHPDLPVAGTCPRCGSYVCIRCAPKAASDVFTCADCLAREEGAPASPELSPFGGPLPLILLGLVLNLVFAFFTIASSFNYLKGDSSWAVLLFDGALLFIALGSGSALLGLLQRKNWARLLAATVCGFEVFMGSMPFGSRYLPVALLCLVALLYLALGKRPKATFSR